MLRNRRIESLIVIFLLTGVIAAADDGYMLAQVSGLSARLNRLVKNAVFEVVLEKPQNDPTVYERELNWENVPYAIRSDKYYSIGTAFAISPTELATAFHVINLGRESKVYDRYYIRDSSGGVFEVDEVTAGNRERDFLIFTVNGRTFREHFTLKRDFKINEGVYSIGNALGEGIVVRAGMILGTVPEAEAGRWNLLKSSADGNPGNSGGPLVNARGQVVGLVTSLRDNILYSTPAAELIDASREIIIFRSKPSFEHLLLTNSFSQSFEIKQPLPWNYKELQKNIVSAYENYYVWAMKALFRNAPDYITGPNNAYLFWSTIASIFPQIDFVDRNDSNWKLSRMDVKSINLQDDGRLLYSTVSDFNFFKIVRPKTTALSQLDTDPKFILDTILSNWRMERTLWRSDKYRILSLGEPVSTGRHTDELGRIWITANWVIGFDDRVLIMFILPLPGGPAVISTIQSSADLFVYDWDIKRIADHIHVAYSATLEDWNSFLALGDFMPPFFKNFSFSWNNESAVMDLKLEDFSIKSDGAPFSLSDNSELFLLPAYYQQHDKIKLGITKLIMNRNNRGNDYFVLVKNLKPDPRLGMDYRDEWEDLLEEKFPFNGKPSLSPKDNNGSIGAVLKPENAGEYTRWTLYLTLENPTETELSEKFSGMENGIKVFQ